MKVVIDRFEGMYAICEKPNRKMIDIKRINIPTSAREGDVLNIEDDIITIDYNETKKRRKQIEEITKNLFE